MLALALAALLAADDLATLLARGPVVSVETDAQGKFEAAVALAEIAAPLEVVWAAVTDFGSYREFVPRVVGSEVSKLPLNVHVRFEIESPGPNTRYTVEYTLDPRAHVAEGRQISGDLSGSRWRWELSEGAPGHTRVKYTSRAKNFSKVLSAFEDEVQTLTAGLNVGAALTMLRALQKRVQR